MSHINAKTQDQTLPLLPLYLPPASLRPPYPPSLSSTQPIQDTCGHAVHESEGPVNPFSHRQSERLRLPSGLVACGEGQRVHGWLPGVDLYVAAAHAAQAPSAIV